MPMPMPERLLALVDEENAATDLAEAALLVATLRYPDLDIARYLAEIDRMAEAIRDRIPEESSEQQRLAGINDYLFGELGFGPDADNYYDPRNSFLNDVMDRRLGIPITLSILYIAIGRRLDLDVEGVSFPGHFLLKCYVDQGVVVIDAYHRGVSLSLEELGDRLRSSQSGEVSNDSLVELLEAASSREIVARMLRNLKAIHLKAKQSVEALDVIEWLVHLVPDVPQELRDRGLVYEDLECFRAALSDFEAYLRAVPDASDADPIRDRVLEMRKAAARLN
ncbi:MAG: tetratricopeptide repeat protein [Betaproteobacteria bacterium]|nr:tetratricopeptide repeat protein [Betaproteobacteria bacterium]